MSGVDRVQLQPHLKQLLDEEAHLLGELQSVLERETHILRGEDAAAIRDIGAARHHCTARLTQLDQERADLCRMLSFGGGAAALQKLFEWADPAGALQRHWQANLQAARRCRDANDRNGALVAAKLHRVQQLLGKLRGAETPAVYGPKAARAARLAARELGRA